MGPGLDRKRPDLVFEAILGDVAPEEWRGEVEQVFFRGRPFENEVAFFHRASRTLILCDLAFNFGPHTATPTRLLMKLLRSYGRLGPTTLDPWGTSPRIAWSRGAWNVAWDHAGPPRPQDSPQGARLARLAPTGAVAATWVAPMPAAAPQWTAVRDLFATPCGVVVQGYTAAARSSSPWLWFAP